MSRANYFKSDFKLSKLISFALVLGVSSLAWGATIKPASCASLLSLQPNYTNCLAKAEEIRNCIQNSMASHSSDSSGSIQDQIQQSAKASQKLAQLDFQCQYYVAYGSEPPAANSAPSGTLSSIKAMLHLSPETSAPAAADNSAATNQASQLNSLAPTQIPTQKNTSDDEDKKSSINWF